MIKAVIFDFDGTLMNTLPSIAHFSNIALTSIGLGEIELEKFKYFVGDGRDKLIHRSLAYHNADTEENFKKAVKVYDFEYEKDILWGSSVYDGIEELLKKLKDDGFKIGVCSNKPHNVADMIVKKVFGDIFDACYGQTKDIPIKPAPDVAIKIAEEFGVLPSECAFVGDTNVDVQTGNNAKMYSIGVLWGFREKEELKKANSIVNSPDEIYEIVKKLK